MNVMYFTRWKNVSSGRPDRMSNVNMRNDQIAGEQSAKNIFYYIVDDLATYEISFTKDSRISVIC